MKFPEKYPDPPRWATVPPRLDAYRLSFAVSAVARAAEADYEAAAKAGDVRRRAASASRLEALRALAGDLGALHEIVRQLEARA